MYGWFRSVYMCMSDFFIVMTVFYSCMAVMMMCVCVRFCVGRDEEHYREAS